MILNPTVIKQGGGAGWETAPESWATGLVDRTLSGSVYGSMVLSIRRVAFYSCSQLTGVEFPACTTIDNTAFCGCRALTTASFPACTTISYSAFSDCRAITTASFPACTTIDNYAFSNCTALTTASFPACTKIGQGVFSNCYRLISLYLTGSLICTLSNSNAFTSTPIGGYSVIAGQYGNIYVPASLLASYQAAANWSYFSSRFVGV